MDEKYIEDLDHRERGYDRVTLPDGSVTLYNGETLGNCIVYKGKKDKQSSNILPNPFYFDICKNGAKSHSETFYDDYMQTTYKNDLQGNFVLI